MIAYKFLRADRTGPFSGFRWPGPGVWVQASRDLAACRRGIHGCRTRDLPWWLGEELWEIELGGEVEIGQHKLVAPAGRLASLIDGWTTPCANEFAEACARRARDRAVGALIRVGQRQAANQLATRETLEDSLSTARQLAADFSDIHVSLTIAGDGAFYALSGAAAMSAYIAAHAALRLEGPAGYAAERTWQSRWLADRLGLRHDA
jgi:hypothetical protein